MKKVIITGATGFLGRHLIAELQRTDVEVVALCRMVPEKSLWAGITFHQGDIVDPYSLREAFIQADIVIHMAALVSADPSDDERMFQINVVGTRNIVDACLSAGVKRLIYVSSVAGLSAMENDQGLDEKKSWKGLHNGYGYTKYLGGLEVRKGEAEGLEVAIVHPAVIFGPGDADRSSGKILKLIRTGMPIATEGIVNGVDARDVVELVIRLAKGEGTGKHYVLSGFTMTWKDLFESLTRAFGRTSVILTVPTPIAKFFVWCYEMCCRLIRIRPSITVNAIKMATSGNSYNGQNVTKELGFKYRSWEETLKWVLSHENAEISQFKEN